MYSYKKLTEAEVSDLKIEVFQWYDGTLSQLPDLNILDEAIIAGNKEKFMPRHMPFEYQIKIKDDGFQFYDSFKNKQQSDFKIICYRNSVAFFTGFLLPNVSKPRFWQKFGTSSIICSDGITSLRDQKNDYTGVHALADLFYSLIDDIGLDLEFNFVFNYQPEGSTETTDIPPNKIHVRPEDFISDLESSTKYDLLMRMVSFYKLQIFQEDNEYWLMQRNLRDTNPVTKYHHNGTSWSTGSFNPFITFNSDDLLSENTFQKTFKPLSVFNRTFHIPQVPFEIKNPSFDNWTSGEADDWIPITGSVTKLTSPNRLKLDTTSSVRKQVIERVLQMSEDRSKVTIQCSGTFHTASGLPNGQFTPGLFQIIAYNTQTDTVKYIDGGGNGSSSPVWIESSFIAGPGGYNSSYPFSLSVNLTLPLFDLNIYIAIILSATAGDGLKSAGPVEYDSFTVSISPDLENQVTEQRYSYNNSQVGNQEQDDVYIGDVTPVSAGATHRILKGSSPELIRTRDWASANNYQSINELVVKDYLKARADFMDGYSLSFLRDYGIKLYNTVKFDTGHGEKKFIPTLRKQVGKNKVKTLFLTELDEGPEPT